MGRKQKSNTVKEKYNFYYLLPIIFILSIVPLIVFMKVDILEGVKLEYWKGNKQNLDFFSYSKAQWFLIATVIAIILFIIRQKLKRIEVKKSYYYISILVYALFIILSTVFAEHKDVALYGFVERYEGMYVLLSYLAVLFITINLVNSEKDIKYIISALVISATILGIIGLFQYIGYDFFKSNFGRHLILPQKYHGMAQKIKFSFGKYIIYSTLYNPNYVGSYMAMLFPLSLSIFLFVKNKFIKVAASIFSVLMFINWIGCNSSAGIVGGIFGVLVLLIMFRKHIIKNIKKLSLLFIVFIISTGIMNSISDGRVSKEVNTLLSISKKSANTNSETPNKTTRIEDITIKGNKISIFTNTETLHVLLDGNELKFFDDNEKLLVIRKYNNKITIEDERYSEYEFEIPPKQRYIKTKIGNKTVYFYYSSQGFKFIGHQGKPREIEYPEKWGFEGKEKLGSSRGYIWSRSLPLLKDTFILGYGPDTYAIYFPQNDFIGKLNAFNTTTKIVDKPHNMYLQIGINTGVISLIAVLVMFGMYFISSIKLYIKRNISTFTEFIGVGVFAAFCGYSITALFNDSVVSVAPVFWVLFGLGISINMKLKEQDEILTK